MNSRRAALLAALLGFAAASLAHAVTLDAALARTLENNAEIREAKANLEAAAGRRLVFRSAGLPDISAIVPAGVQGGHRAGEKTVQPFAFARGAFTQPIINFGVPASFRRGNIEVLIAKQRLNIAVMEQLHGARLAFYTAAYNRSLGVLAEAQRERLQTNARTQADRYQAGRVDRGALTVARLLEQQHQPRIEEARRLEQGALLKLAQAMGDPLTNGAKLPAIDGELQFAQLRVDPDAEARVALDDRADLKLARLLVRAAAEDQRIIAAAYYPAINASISGDYIPVSDIRRSSEGSARRSDDIISSEMRVGATFTWRVIDNGRVTGAVIRQRAAREINQLVLDRLEADVPRELARIANNLHALDERQAALARAVTTAEQTVAAVQNNLSEGLSSQLEYRTAESSYLETQAGLLSIAYEQNIARAEWDRAAGRYFQFSDDSNGNVR